MEKGFFQKMGETKYMNKSPAVILYKWTLLDARWNDSLYCGFSRYTMARIKMKFRCMCVGVPSIYAVLLLLLYYYGYTWVGRHGLFQDRASEFHFNACHCLQR